MHFLSDKLSPSTSPSFSGHPGLEIEETGDVKKRCITVAQKGCACVCLHGPHMPGAGL